MGYNMNDVYPSNYLKASDFEGKAVAGEIADVQLEKVGTDEKLVLFFKNIKKGLVLNKTNANNISLVFGMDTDGWIGGTIQMYPTMVDFKGQSMEGIRVKAQPRPAGRRQGPSPQQFPDKGSYGTVSSGPPKRQQRASVQDDPRMAMTEQGPPFDDEIPL